MPYGPCLGKIRTKRMILAPPVREGFQRSRLPEQICQGGTRIRRPFRWATERVQWV